MFWLSYECFSISCNAFLLKSAISSHNSCDGNQLLFVSAITNVRLSSFPDPVDWAVVFQDEEDILHVHGSFVSTFSKEFIWNCSAQFT